MIIILMGVAGSGKTTIGALLAERLGWRFYDADDFHSDANKAKMSSGQALTDADRIDWLSALRDLLRNAIESDRSAVLACSALKKTYRDRLQVSDAVRFVYLRGTFPQIEKRMRARAGHFMKADLLHSQFEILEEPDDAVIGDIAHSPAEVVTIICRALNL